MIISNSKFRFHINLQSIGWIGLFFVLFYLNLINANETIAEQKSPIATLPKQGDIQGVIRHSRSGKEYFAYLGIPYAEPPQRFKNPKPTSAKWDGVRDGAKLGSECVQMSFTTGKPSGSEDCLFANVYTPTLTPDKPISTIIFIHGGGFQYGSGAQSGVDYFMDEDVVFVTFNYRLGALGFLNTGDGQVDGNVGFKDQTVVMAWVRENIEAFGGSNHNLTIFGGSAGAAAVSYHIISPMSKGLFERAISGSGSAQCAWAFDRNPQKHAKRLATELNCPNMDNSFEIVECLKGKDASEFVGKNFSDTKWSLDSMVFRASREYYETTTDNGNIFLPDDPAILLEEGKFSKVPWLTGATRNEGLALNAAAIIHSPQLLKDLNEDWNTIAPITFSFQNIFPANEWDKVSEKIRKFYFGTNIISKETGDVLEQLYSDRNFFEGIRRTILQQAKHNSPVYPYFFDYKGTRSWLEDLYGFNTTGVAHADDFAYYFKFHFDPNNPQPGGGLEPNSPAEEMSKKLVKLIISFAETGVPYSLWGNAEWPKVSLDEANGIVPLGWYHLNEMPTWEREPEAFTNRMEFWEDLIKTSSSNTNRSEL